MLLSDRSNMHASQDMLRPGVDVSNLIKMVGLDTRIFQSGDPLVRGAEHGRGLVHAHSRSATQGFFRASNRSLYEIQRLDANRTTLGRLRALMDDLSA